MDKLKTLDLFREQISLEIDYEFGYAAIIYDKSSGKAVIKGVGTTPHLATEDLANKWNH